jgi:hypothetical protein
MNLPPGELALTPLAQSNQHGPLDRRMRWVLDLDPFARTPGSVAAVSPFGDDSLQAHDARLAEHDRAVDVLDESR